MPHFEIAPRASWQPTQDGFDARDVLRFACRDAFHSSTNGWCVPVWQSPQLPLLPNPSLASGLTRLPWPMPSTCCRPAPWQLSHCTSWYTASLTPSQPAVVPTAALPRPFTVWQPKHESCLPEFVFSVL